MAQTNTEILDIYWRNLSRYEAEGNTEKAAVERRLVARIEAQV